jgi:AcrR family transcriptional regulator
MLITAVMNHNGRYKEARRTSLRLEILRSAAGAFRRKGFERAGMRDIAGALGLTTGALYYQFRSKQELLYFCQDYSLDRLLEEGARIRREKAAPSARLRRLIEAQLTCMLDELQGSAAHVEFASLPSRLLKKVVLKRDRYERLMRGIVTQGMRTGAFRKRDPKLVTLAMLGAINWTIKWYRPEGPKSPAKIAREFADYLIKGIA